MIATATSMTDKPKSINGLGLKANHVGFGVGWFFIVASLCLSGAGSTLYGVQMPGNLSTFCVYGAFFTLLFTGQIRLSRGLILLYAYIFIQTFILHYSNASAGVSMVQFAGVILFSITGVSFVAANPDRIPQIVRLYYRFVIFACALAILQTAFFVLFHVSIYFQDLTGSLRGQLLVPQNFDILPRATSVATEPAEFGLLIMPGIYLAISVLVGQARQLGLTNRWTAGLILLGVVLSFSVVAYAGAAVSLLVIAAGHARKIGLVRILCLVALFAAGGILISQIAIGSKVTSMLDAVQDPLNFEYTPGDLTGFALISNAFVAEQALIGSDYLGTGLNTHQFSYDATIGSIFTGDQIIVELNKADAGSLFIHLLSEFGIPGFLAFLWFLFRYKIIGKESDETHRLVNDASFVSLIVYAARDGIYLDIELWLLMGLLCCTASLSRTKRATLDLTHP